MEPHDTEITTVEGILDRCVAGLSQEQPLRRALDPSAADQIDAFIDRLRAVQRFEKGPFTLLVDDPSGNSHVENPMVGFLLRLLLLLLLLLLLFQLYFFVRVKYFRLV